MDTPRTVYKVDPAHPGSDVATLATGSIVFREAYPAYSKRLLARAVSVFEQAPVRAAGPHARPSRPREHAHLFFERDCGWKHRHGPMIHFTSHGCFYHSSLSAYQPAQTEASAQIRPSSGVKPAHAPILFRNTHREF